MNWQDLAQALFPHGHEIRQDGYFLSGDARVAMPDGMLEIAVIGTCQHAEIGVEIALRQAQAVLAVVQHAPQKPLLLLVDTQGQRLRHRDEMLGINSYMAHLGKCVQLARQQGHAVLALVYDQALSGGFLSTGLMADACHALPETSIRVMDLGAMARITRLPLERLQELARDNPVFAPGPENFVRMGGIAALWTGQLALHLQQALLTHIAQSGQAQAGAGGGDQRAALGAQRGGRSRAHAIVQAVLASAQP